MKKQFLNKWLCYVTAGMLAFSFSACSDDDDNGPAFGPDGKRLVSKIIGVDDEGDREEHVFSYNGEGRINRYSFKEIYTDEGGKYTDEDIINYSVKDNVLTVYYEYREDGDLNVKAVATFQLNEDGYAKNGEENLEEYDGGEVYRTQKTTYSYTYDVDRYLLSERVDDESPFTYSHNDKGDYTSGSYYSYYTYYEDEENKANIGFYECCRTPVAGENGLCLNEFGYLGKSSKHLLKTHSDEKDTISYEFDTEGYVTKFTVTERDGTKMVYEVKYN